MDMNGGLEQRSECNVLPLSLYAVDINRIYNEINILRERLNQIEKIIGYKHDGFIHYSNELRSRIARKDGWWMDEETMKRFIYRYRQAVNEANGIF